MGTQSLMTVEINHFYPLTSFLPPTHVQLLDDDQPLSNSAASFESPKEMFLCVAEVDKVIEEIIIPQSTIYAQCLLYAKMSPHLER